MAQEWQQSDEYHRPRNLTAGIRSPSRGSGASGPEPWSTVSERGAGEVQRLLIFTVIDPGLDDDN